MFMRRRGFLLKAVTAIRDERKGVCSTSMIPGGVGDRPLLYLDYTRIDYRHASDGVGKA